MAGTQVFGQPDPDTLRRFAEDIRDGPFEIPVSERTPLREAGAAQSRMAAGGGGKIVFTMR